MSETRARFCIMNGNLEIEGSELFVTQQVDGLKDIVIEMLSRHRTPIAAIEDLRTQGTPDESSDEGVQAPSGTNKFERALSVHNDKLHITGKVPGKNKADKTINTALVYMWGRDFCFIMKWWKPMTFDLNAKTKHV